MSMSTTACDNFSYLQVCDLLAHTKHNQLLRGHPVAKLHFRHLALYAYNDTYLGNSVSTPGRPQPQNSGYATAT